MQTTFLFVAIAIQAIFSSVAKADFLDVLNLPVGTQFRVLLVTADRVQGNSTDIGFYNQFATNQANQAPKIAALGTTWSALLSTANTNAITNTGTQPSADPLNPSGVVIVRYDGLKIADNYNDLWDGSIDDVIELDQLGHQFPYSVWTGTQANGSATIGFELGSTNRIAGAASSSTTGSFWIESGFFNSTSNTDHIYALSGILIAVPEPSSLMLVAALVPFAGLLRMRRSICIRNSANQFCDV